MDPTEFWQENKRWVLGVALGFVVFLIARAIIGSVYSTAPASLEARRLLTGSGDPLFGTEELARAREDDKALQAELARLRKALEFHPDPGFALEGKGVAPDAFLTQQGRELKKRLIGRADALDVALLDRDIAYPTPVEFEEIRRTLLGLDVVNQAASRLLTAHEKVRSEDPDATALRAIQQLKVEDRQGPRSRLGMRPIRRGGRDQVDLSEILSENRVAFQFQADSATTLLFLEMLKDPDNPLALDELTITQGTRKTDPLTVKGQLVALVFKDKGKEQP